jgi:hypothetical protein
MSALGRKKSSEAKKRYKTGQMSAFTIAEAVSLYSFSPFNLYFWNFPLIKNKEIKAN